MESTNFLAKDWKLYYIKIIWICCYFRLAHLSHLNTKFEMCLRYGTKQKTYIWRCENQNWFKTHALIFKKLENIATDIVASNLVDSKRINWNQNQKFIYLTKNSSININQIWARQYSKPRLKIEVSNFNNSSRIN